MHLTILNPRLPEKARRRSCALLWRGNSRTVRTSPASVTRTTVDGVGWARFASCVSFGAAQLKRLLPSTRSGGNAVCGIYMASSIGYAGSIAGQVYMDLFQSDINRFEFFHAFTYAFSLLGAGLLVASCIYFLPRTRPSLETRQTGTHSV